MIIDKKSFAVIKKDLEHTEEQREHAIQHSRELIKISKQLIYALHRDDMKSAEELREEIQKKFKGLDYTKDYETGIVNVAVQEYVEAVAYYDLLIKGKLPTDKELDVPVEEYLMGLCDLTGELMRKAVDAAIKKDFEKVKMIREVVTELYGLFLQFDLRNGELRKKFDSIKWNLQKIEDVLLNIQE